jgi:hypothetical protein
MTDALIFQNEWLNTIPNGFADFDVSHVRIQARR